MMASEKSITVELVGGAPWGFRLGGGADFGIPLEIAKIRRKSKADAAGLKEGDVVTRIDNQDVGKKSHGEAMTIIEAAGSILRLSIARSAGAEGISIPVNKPVTLQIDSFDGGSSGRSRAGSIPIDIQHYRVPVPAATASPVPSLMTTNPLKSPGSIYQVQPPTSAVWRAETQTSSRTMSNDGDRQVTIISQRSSVQAAPSWHSVSAAPQQQQQRSPRPSIASAPAASAGKNTTSSVEPWTVELTSYSLPISYKTSIIKSPAFNIKKHDVKRVVWSPAVVAGSQGSPREEERQVSYRQPVYRASSQPPPETRKLDVLDDVGEQPQQSYYIPEPPPLEGLTRRPEPYSNRRIPGMVNPLITEHGAGRADAALNRSGRTSEDGKGESTASERKKKIYSDSSFYDAPGMDYPTVDEQVEMCKRIAVLLDSDHNSKSRGGRMFAKRKATAEQWAIESSARKPDASMSWSYDGASDLGGLPLFHFRNPSFGYNQVRHHPEPIKSHLTAEEVERLKANERNIVKHDSLSPNLAFDVTSALMHSSGKGGQIFAKRRERADKYVVDETNVKKPASLLSQQQQQSTAHLAPGPAATRLVVQTLTPAKAAMSPWEAAMEGNLSKAFEHLNSYKKYEVFEVPVNSALSQPPAAMTRSLPPSSFAGFASPATGNDTPDGASGRLHVSYKPFQPVRPPGSAAFSTVFTSDAGQGRMSAGRGGEVESQGDVTAAQPSSFAYPGSYDQSDRLAGNSRAKSEPRGVTSGGPSNSYTNVGYGHAAIPKPSEKSYNALPRGFGLSTGGTWSPGLQQTASASAGVSVF